MNGMMNEGMNVLLTH